MAKMVVSSYDTFVTYINEMLDIGYLTKEKVANHSLRNFFIHFVVKCYAMSNYKAYIVNLKSKNMHVYDECFLYMTDKGKDWLFSFLESKSYAFLHSTFDMIFAPKERTPDLPKDYRDWHKLGNVLGITGRNDTVHRREVRVTRVYGKRKQFKDETFFTSIPAARDYIMMMSRTCPLDEFTLHYKQAVGRWRKTSLIDGRKLADYTNRNLGQARYREELAKKKKEANK